MGGKWKNGCHHSVRKEMGSIPMGHRLSTHTGLCRYLHGHNYQWSMTLERIEGGLQEHGMVTDFDTFKVFKKLIEDKYDHSLILQEDDPIAHLLTSQMAKEINNGDICKLVRIKEHPTVEVITMLWAKEIQQVIEQYYGNLCITEIEVHETPNSSCILKL